MNLMALRTEVELGMRGSFDQRKYHDFLLAQDLLPPEILRQAVLEEFVAGADEFVSTRLIRNRCIDQPAWRFDTALGSRHPAAEPNSEAFEIEFEPKVKLELKRAPAGGGLRIGRPPSFPRYG